MGEQHHSMGCGGSEEEKEETVQAEAEPQGEWVDHWAKLQFHVDKKMKPKKIIAAINEMLQTVDRGCEERMQIEALVPLWTPDYTAFDGEKKLIKQLKHSRIAKVTTMTHESKSQSASLVSTKNNLMLMFGTSTLISEVTSSRLTLLSSETLTLMAPLMIPQGMSST